MIRLARFVEKPAVKFLLIFLIFFALGLHRLDPDFGWHLKSGDYYRQHGIPAHDIYTYTARNFAWINHEWGNDLILSLLYSIGGYGLAAAAYALIWTAAFFVRGAKTRLVFLLAAVAAVFPYAGIRPVAWTVLLFSLLLNFLQKDEPPIWLIACLFALWANLHGGFIIGLAVILYYLAKRRSLAYAKLLVISGLATFINPYGPRIYVEVFRTLTDSRLHSQIAEWRNFQIFRASLPFICLWGAGFVLFKARRLRNWLSLPPIMFAAALSASRNMPLFVVASLPQLEKSYQKFRGEAPNKLPPAAQAILVGGAVVIFGSIIYTSYNELLPWGDRQSSYPVQAVSYLQKNSCQGNLFNDYNYGGYLIWKLPAKKVYIDGRMPSWRGPDGHKYLSTYFDMLKKSDVRQAEFKKYDIKCVLISSSEKKFISGLSGQGWRTISQANNATLLKK